MTDAERVLRILLHDLRTPIGVAQGYLRMMQDGRLTEAAETERAVAKALQALGQPRDCVRRQRLPRYVRRADAPRGRDRASFATS